MIILNVLFERYVYANGNTRFNIHSYFQEHPRETSRNKLRFHTSPYELRVRAPSTRIRIHPDRQNITGS